MPLYIIWSGILSAAYGSRCPQPAGELDSRVAGGKDRTLAAATAKAEGLYLVAVDTLTGMIFQNRQWARYFWRTTRIMLGTFQAVANVVTA